MLGPKGSGKGAIYTTLLRSEDSFFDKGILLVPAEEPRGTPVFSNLTPDPPPSEAAFIALWKPYMRSLIGSVLVDYDEERSA